MAGNNNHVYKASYTTSTWVGDLTSYKLNGADATIGTQDWSASTNLDAVTDRTTRTIYFNNGTTTPSLGAFAYGNLNTTQKAYFDNICPTNPATTGVTAKAYQVAQCASLTGADLTAANKGTNLVDWLRGVQTYEAAVAGTTTVALYRPRVHILGDIIDGAPVYVGKPPFSYADAGYSDFVVNQTSRKPMVYAASNDGMLHAFSADTSDGGNEIWAYIPTAVMPNLYRLTDTSYSLTHQFFVDGAPVMGDIYVGGNWMTILVGGFNDGGQGYYALDITTPTSPKLLWEFTDPNLGYSYGNPIITKRADGTWVVAFTSGYNNGDGDGHLFVVNAATGVKWQDIKTGNGTATAPTSTTPTGLSKINAWIENATDNTSIRFYGGDLLGNLWRFDTDSLLGASPSAVQLAQFQINSTTPQSITTQPQTVSVGNRAVVVVGTGRYLGTSDIADKTQQSIYAVADDLGTTGWGDVRNGSNANKFVQQTFTLDTTTGLTASISSNPVNFGSATVAGWWVDLPNSGERVVNNMSVQFNTLAIATAIPSGDACSAGGSSWRYFLNVTNGQAVSTNPVGMQWSATALIVGMSWIKDSSGNVRVIYQNSDGTVQTEIPPTSSSPPGDSANRTSWRELTN